MINEGLCVGGPLAGKRRSVIQGAFMMVFQRDQSCDNFMDWSDQTTFQRLIYRWMPLRVDEDTVIGFWVFQGLSALDAIGALMQAYEVVGNHLHD